MTESVSPASGTLRVARPLESVPNTAEHFHGGAPSHRRKNTRVVSSFLFTS